MFNHRPQSRISIGFVGFFMAALLVLLALPSFAQSTLPVPVLSARVIDQTATLTAEEILTLSKQLQTLETERGAQVVVLMVASTQPEDIFSYSNRVANAWKIGRKDVGDGVLIVVAKNDRKLRIEIAKSLEGAIPDVLAGQIINESITPKFKQGQYASGLQSGVAQIAARIADEIPTERNDVDNGAQNGAHIAGITAELPSLPVLLLIGFLILIAFKLLGFSNTLILLSSLSRGNSNSGYSSGGGFSSGGGGNFGGGGASGDW